jgi:type 1 glutamine amidotransferase
MNLFPRPLTSALCLLSLWIGALQQLTPAAEPPAAGDSADRQILVVVGPSEHPPGTHEVPATGRLLKHCLEQDQATIGLQVTINHGWPEDQQLLDAADSVIFLGDFFPLTRIPERTRAMEQLRSMMQRGVGLVCIHFATGLAPKDVDQDGHHPLLDWLGGYFATACHHHQSVAKVLEATIEPAAGQHPILRGWEAFTLFDEPYYNNYFGPPQRRSSVIPIAIANLPPEAPQPEVVAWALERPDGGRGFGVVMPHFFESWLEPNLRTMILNGIVWSAGVELPADGFSSSLEDLNRFEPTNSGGPSN